MMRLKLTALDTAPALLAENQIRLSFDVLDDADAVLVSVTFSVNAASNADQIIARAWDEVARAWRQQQQLTRLLGLVGRIVDRRDNL